MLRINTGNKLSGQMQLSPFQKEKLEYYFKLFGNKVFNGDEEAYRLLRIYDPLFVVSTKPEADGQKPKIADGRSVLLEKDHSGVETVEDSDGNGILELKDLDGFMKKVLDYTKWPEESRISKQCLEVHQCFFSSILEHANKNHEDHVSLDRWLKMWDEMIPGCMTMNNFPIWAQLLPVCLFRIIDSKADNQIDQEELSRFYAKFVGISPDKVQSLTKYAMDQMTDHGRYPLTLDSYEQMFANFLIGKTPYGPGRFIFGCFEHVVERTSFKLIQEPSEQLSEQLPEPLKPWSVHNPKTPTPIVKVKFFRAG